MRPSNKVARLDAIRQAIREQEIGSQQQLADILVQQGINVTQATLSRDLEELHAAKVRYPDGIMAYWIPDDNSQNMMEIAALTMAKVAEPTKTEQYLARVLGGLVTSVRCANNLIVVRTPSGAAQYAASALDRQPISGILGTIAGDDTVLIIAVNEQQAANRAQWLIHLTSDDITSGE